MNAPPNIVLRRHGMRGDILVCTAIIRAVKKKYPTAGIFFAADYPGVLANNPHLRAPAQTSMQHNDAASWMLGNFSDNRGKHLIHIMAAGFSKPGEVEKLIEIFPKQADFDWAGQRMPQTPAVVIAPGPGKWHGKNWDQAKWNAVIEALLPSHPVVVVGTKDQNSYRLLPQVFDLRGQTNEMQLAAIIYQAKLFIGIDGFPLHVAGAVRTKRIGLFGVTRPELILCNAPWFACCSDPVHPCTGKRHQVGSITELGCKYDRSEEHT